jgi:hypothetical protein
MKVEIWGRVGNSWLSVNPDRGKGKGKEVEGGPVTDNTNDWKILEEWNVKLADLVPLPDDVSLTFADCPFLSSHLFTSLLLTPRTSHPIPSWSPFRPRVKRIT